MIRNLTALKDYKTNQLGLLVNIMTGCTYYLLYIFIHDLVGGV